MRADRGMQRDIKRDGKELVGLFKRNCGEKLGKGKNEGREGTVFCCHLACSLIQNVDTGS